MKRFFTKEKCERNVTLFDMEHSHLANVLRCKTGEQIILCRGDEFDYIYKILKISKNQTELEFVIKEINTHNPIASLTVFLGIIKRWRYGFICVRRMIYGSARWLPGCEAGIPQGR